MNKQHQSLGFDLLELGKDSWVNLSIGLQLFQPQGNLLPCAQDFQRPAVDEGVRSSRKPMEYLLL